MAAISKSGTPSLATTVPGPEHTLSGLLAGEAIGAGDACYIKTSDGKVYKSTAATPGDAAAIIDGFALTGAAVGQAVTLAWGVNLHYGAAMSPGTLAYLSDTTAGALVDTAEYANQPACARVIDATRIYVFKVYHHYNGVAEA